MRPRYCVRNIGIEIWLLRPCHVHSTSIRRVRDVEVEATATTRFVKITRPGELLDGYENWASLPARNVVLKLLEID